VRGILLPAGTRPEAGILLLAKGLRAFGDGFLTLLLPAYLTLRDFGPFAIGALLAASVAGSSMLALLVGLAAHRWPAREVLTAAAFVAVLTGAAFSLLADFWPLLLVSFLGTYNSSGDIGLFQPVEQAQLARMVSARQRTSLFARYSAAGAFAGSLGALAAGAPEFLGRSLGLGLPAAIQIAFVLYAFLGIVAAILYRRLPAEPVAADAPVPKPLHKSRRVVLKLAALFSLDAFGSGFIVPSLVALWLFERFGLSLTTAATIFFWMGALSGLSYFAAVPIARRIGLVNTMVFTHLPSSICLLLIPFMPSLGPVVLLFMVRSALSQMDVPARTSYVMAVVEPDERTAAASLTAVPRSIVGAVSPMLAGFLLASASFGWPLALGGGVKIIYDLLLLAMFRKVSPPEEN
jgi:predicted MFS family arabinose efflux permease